MTILGAEFNHQVNQLQDHLRALQDGRDLPRVVLLEAPSGSGKSRIVREVYERLRSEQPVNADGKGYWPSLESGQDGGDGGDPLRARKVIGPPSDEGFIRPEDALPAFFWLPVQCSQAPDGSLTPTIELMRPAMNAHARFLTRAWLKAVSGPDFLKAKLDEAVEKLKSLGTDLAWEAATTLIGAVAPAVPGVGVLTAQARNLASWTLDQWKTNQDVAAGGGLDRVGQSPEELARDLLLFAHPKLPCIVVVEDAHLMDGGLADALLVLAEPNAKKPVLVIATAEPGGVLGKHYEPWRDKLLTPDGELRALLISEDTEPSFPVLGEVDRIEMVKAHASQTEDETARLIAHTWQNPYALQVALLELKEKEKVIQGAYIVTLDDLNAVPEGVDTFYRNRLRNLPADVKDGLALAAGALPERRYDGSVQPFTVRVVAAAADRSSSWGHERNVADALSDATGKYPWLERAPDLDEDGNTDVVAFREWPLERVARSAYENKSPGDRRLFEEGVKSALAERIEQDVSSPRLLPLARWLLGLDPSRDDRVAAIAALTSAEALRHTDPGEAIRLLTTPDRIAPLDNVNDRTLWFKARYCLARALSRAAQRSRAIEAFKALLEDQLKSSGNLEDPETLRTRSSLAAELRLGKKFKEAVKQYQLLLRSQLQMSNGETRYTLRTRSSLAGTMLEAGQAKGAIREYERLLEVQMRLLPEGHPDNLRTRDRLAQALLMDKQLAKGIEVLEGLLIAQEEALGPDDPSVRRTRERLESARRNAEEVKASTTRRGEAKLPNTMGLMIPSPGAIAFAEQLAPKVEVVQTPRVVNWALAFSLLGILGGVTALVGLPLGIMSRRRARLAGVGVGRATAAIVISSAWLLLAAFLLIAAGLSVQLPNGSDGGATRACVVLRDGYDSARLAIPDIVPSYQEAVNSIDGVLERFNLRLPDC